MKQKRYWLSGGLITLFIGLLINYLFFKEFSNFLFYGMFIVGAVIGFFIKKPIVKSEINSFQMNHRLFGSFSKVVVILYCILVPSLILMLSFDDTGKSGKLIYPIVAGGFVLLILALLIFWIIDWIYQKSKK